MRLRLGAGLSGSTLSGHMKEKQRMEEAMIDQCLPYFRIPVICIDFRGSIYMLKCLYVNPDLTVLNEISQQDSGKTLVLPVPYCDLLRPQWYTMCHFMSVAIFILEVIIEFECDYNKKITQCVLYYENARYFSKDMIWYDIISITKVIER